MKHIAFLLSLLIISAQTYSQDFLVTHKGDTLRGEINIRDKKILLKQAGSSLKIFPADDVAYLSSGKYNGLVVHCDLIIYSDKIDVVQKWNFNGGGISDTVLVLKEIFSTTKMNLYEVFDKDRTVHYFVKKPTDTLPVQMMVHYFIEGNGDYSFSRNNAMVSQITQQRIYADQLRVIMADCPKINQDDLEMLDYRSYSLKKIIRRYNKCK